MVAGIIARCGTFGGRLGKGPGGNDRGFYENTEIREQVVKPYLYRCDADLLGQNPLPAIDHLAPYQQLRDDVEKIMIHHGYKTGPWFYKGNQMCLVWPIWHNAFPDAKWIIVRRDDESIAQSCLHTSFMRGHLTLDGWAGWVAEHKKRFQEMRDEPDLASKEVWPTEIVQGDTDSIKAVVRELGLEWQDDAIQGFVSKEMWRPNYGNVEAQSWRIE